MARLTDDCFAQEGGTALSVEAVAELIRERLPVRAQAETLPLAACDGRIAARDVPARIDLPPFDNAAVDGYAVRFSDLSPAGETVLPVSGRSAAGSAPGGFAAGTAVRIFTGAPVPPGADTVFMQEDVRRDGGHVALPFGSRHGANRRVAGEDLARGGRAIPAGRRLTPADLALAAATGHALLDVRRRLRVALFSTGDELAEPGSVLGPGMIFESNRVLIAGLLRRLGAEVCDLGILRDDRDEIARSLAQAAGGHDLVLTSGGVSVGEEDHVKAAVEAAGRLTFWRLAIKPGRPVAMGSVGGTPFVGLPGNPVAAYVTMLFVVRPLLARLGGAVYEPPLALPVRANFSHAKKPGRREYLRVGLRPGADGLAEAVKLPGAGALTSLTGSDGLALLPDEATAVAPGDIVAVHPHALLW